MALEAATDFATSQDMEVGDFLATFTDDSLDMTQPTRGDDE